ncbi:MAG: UDP-N-acetylmuramoyl-L-alanine--D-glutamate ligase [Lachnospiraceae bacterium]|nr:UDP-N-acetylmuramoyl-L-alanine--D-glutamate ligase [Lachnospiraceae bacterium]
MNWNQKKVLVVGGGISGIGAARLLEQKGALPILYDENEGIDRNAVSEKLGASSITQILAGELPEEQAKQTELVVLSPGVPVDTPFAEGFRSRGIPVIGEIELAWLCGKGQVLAVTGTNGKTTTTALLGRIMKEYFRSVFVVGNIGTPYTREVEHMEEDSVTVAEISSFQLETIHSFHPRISAILNITPDHLNRHHTMERYVSVKESITRNQGPEDVCVLNYMDTHTRAFASRCPARVVFFSSGTKPEEGYFLEGREIFHREKGETKRLIGMDEIRLLGVHNAENVMAAIAMAAAYGVPMERILSAVRQFQAVEHRIEYVATKAGVAYYNDSKGTNPDAAIKAIQAMERPTVLIGGGYDKNSEYDAWIESFDGKVRYLVLLGQTKEKIAACARRKGFTHILMAENLEEAVTVSAGVARPGDAVLLSPACASWGMFPNYEARGNLFKECVNRLKD